MRRVFIPDGCDIEPHEKEAAEILAGHFSCLIEFLVPSNAYKVRTPDIVMNGRMWEIKSPTSDSNHTIEKQFKLSAGQSHNLVIDGRRSGRKDELLIKDIKRELKLHKAKRRVLFITKDAKVLDITG
ncbi:MAG: hypothetical protein LBM12_02050 [Candidatus Nomurabacteria bacterium]|nr:hypothetical protein [Candidatus Nomurabacteria bacterium]